MLTAALFDEILALRGAGEAPYKVAERFPEVSAGQVSSIWNGKRKRPGWVWERASERTAQREAEKLPTNGRVKRCELSTVEQVELFLTQGRTCYLCEEPLDFDEAHVDHDHLHKVCEGRGCRDCIRGLAHTQCNTSVGLLKDNPDRMRRVAGNLEQTLRKVQTSWEAQKPPAVAIPDPRR